MDDNSWAEHRKVVEFRLDNTDSKIDKVAEKVDDLTGSFARIEERTKVNSGIWGGVAGFLSGLSSWLR